MVLPYAAFAALWILLSDKVMEWLFHSPADITLVNVLKGWLFVAVTSLLLYGLLRRLAGPAAGGQPEARAKARPNLPFALLALAIIVLTGAGITHNINRQKQTEVARMQAIADLKVREIGDWLKERQADAEFVQGSPYYAEQYRRWRGDGDAASGEQLQARLTHFIRNRGFGAAMLLDAKGRRLWGTPAAPHEPAAALHEAVELAAWDGQVRRVGPYLGLAGQVRLDFLAPLSTGDGRGAIVVLHADVANWLYPTLQTWPVPSASGETLLFRRDGDQVLYLNELRHRPDTALKLRVPLARKEVLAAQALRGEARDGEVVEGRDYRNVAVLGVVRAVPGTDWFLLAKMDRAEVRESAASDAAWIGLAGLLALFAAGAGLAIFRQREQLAIADSIQQAQAERLGALRLLAAIADSSDDAIFAKDLNGRYTLFNRAASQFVGKPAGDVLGCDDRAIFPAEQAERLIAAGRKVIAENRSYSEEEVLDTADGQRVFLATKGTLCDAEGQVIGIFGISRDITALKASEAALAASEERLRLALEASRDGLWDWDLRSGAVYRSQRYYELTGYWPDEATADFEFFRRMVHQDDLARVMQNIDAHRQGRSPAIEYDFRLVTRTGAIRWMQVRGRAVERDGGGVPLRIIGTMTDIGARKEAEADLRQQADELARRNAELERFNRATVGRELDIIALKQQVNRLSGQLGLAPPFALDFLDSPEQPAGGPPA